MLTITYTIDDQDLEKRIHAFYEAQKTEGEDIDTFCGRLAISQMIGSEIARENNAMESSMRDAINERATSLARDGESLVSSWVKGRTEKS